MKSAEAPKARGRRKRPTGRQAHRAAGPAAPFRPSRVRATSRTTLLLRSSVGLGLASAALTTGLRGTTPPTVEPPPVTALPGAGTVVDPPEQPVTQPVSRSKTRTRVDDAEPVGRVAPAGQPLAEVEEPAPVVQPPAEPTARPATTVATAGAPEKEPETQSDPESPPSPVDHAQTHDSPVDHAQTHDSPPDHAQTHDAFAHDHGPSDAFAHDQEGMALLEEAVAQLLTGPRELRFTDPQHRTRLGRHAKPECDLTGL